MFHCLPRFEATIVEPCRGRPPLPQEQEPRMSEQRKQRPIDNDAYVREVHDKGLQFDLRTMSRRRMLTALGVAGVLTAVGGRLVTDQSAAAAACAAEVESETAGPYPADGSNGVEIRTVSGVVRSDIR